MTANRKAEDQHSNGSAELAGSRLLQRLSTQLISKQSPEALYEQILDTALELMRADAVSIQLLEDGGKRLRRVATRNLHPDSTEYWTWVDASHASTCGQALSKNERVVVEDVEESPELAGTGDLEAFRASGTRAVQSTPLLTRTGRPIGMISTHWRAPRQFHESEFELFDILARQVADLIERSQIEGALREAEERQTFLLGLSDEMRAHSSADEIIATATRMLGERLQASRIVYAEIDEEAGIARIREGWTASGAEQHPPELKLSDFGGPLLDDLRSGKTVRYDDVGEPPYDRPDLAALAHIGVGAGLSVPHVVNGRFVVNLNVHQDRPRVWTDAEVALTEAVAERTWDAVERARSEEALGASEEKYRLLFETMGQGYGEVELLRDEHGRATDVLYLLLNPAFERFFGIPAADAVGRTAREVLVGIEDYWFEVYDRVSRSGQSDRIELELGPSGGCYALEIHPRGGDRLLILYDDITERKRAEDALRESEERQAFLLSLSDELRPLTDAVEIMGAATRLLGETLGATRAYYAEWPPGTDYVEIGIDYVAPGLPSLVGRYPIEFFRYTDERFREGRTWVIQDAADGTIPAAERDYCLAHGVAAWVDVPLVKGGKLQAALFLVQDTPRCWNATEIALVEETAERTWAALERARAEEAQRESEERYRMLFESIDEGVTSLELLFDEEGSPVDWIYIDTNPAIERMSGLTNVVGKKLSDMVPVEQEWLERFARVAKTGEPERFEQRYEGLGRWFDVYVSRIDGEGSNRLVAVYNNVTGRKRAEALLRESEERQAFLLRFADALRAEPNADAVVDGAIRMLAEELGLDRCYAAEMHAAEDRVDITNEFRRAGLAPMPSLLRFSDFPEAGTRSFDRTLVFDDTANDPDLTDTDKGSLAAMDFGALLSSPVRQGPGNPVWALGAVSSEPRHWTADEVALIEEAAERTWSAVERARIEAALRGSEERYRHIVESAQEYAIVSLDEDGCIVGWNSGAERLLGYTEEEAVGRSGAMFFTSEDRAKVAPEHEMHLADEKGRAINERWHVRKDRSRFWGSGLMFPMEGEGGYLKMFRDGTAERLADERQQLLIEELNHRVKNMLAIIQSLAQQTFRSGEDPDEAKESFEGRLEALARAHNVLTRQHWESADLKEIACAALESCYGRDSHVTVEGPPVLLPSRTTVTVAMALHELCTNAIKYGALSSDTGRVSVTWHVTDGTPPRLHLDWEESGGPEVRRPQRRGFGSRMIERAPAADLGGKVSLDYRPEGLVCTIDCPLPGNIVESADAGG